MIITERKIDRLLNTDFSLVNQLKVTTEEFNALNRCEKEVRYKYVMKRIADTETLWTMAIDATAIGIQIYEGKNSLQFGLQKNTVRLSVKKQMLM